ncbi:hypothetical protein [Actinoplanes sp. NPDC049118]|uniref:hypothetical protein n=1 Tax=Actinoplanes sp. NPDC049118 TaxID=3155769 RepID=UPI0033D5936E
MSYWGTVVVARSHGLLVDQDGVAGFGYRHRWLRQLSDDWQLLETGGSDDPPDLRGSCEAVAASTGCPVLAAYISDDSCAAMCAASPGQVGPLTRLWPVSRTCGTYRHQPRGMAEPAGRGIEEVAAELTAWSDAAGFRADADRLRLAIGRDADRARGQVVDLVFEVVKALGLSRIGRTFPWSLPAFDWPFSGVMFSLGPTDQARQNARYRAAGVAWIPPVQPWETAALALEAELWTALHRPGVDVADLARRAAHLLATYQATPIPQESTTLPAAAGPPVPDEASLRLLAELESRLTSGTMPPWSDETEERRYADSLATEPDPNSGTPF